MTSGDTWGIPGPTFLALFGFAAAILLVVNVAYRLLALAGREQTRPDELTGTEVAYLAGGVARAVQAALGALRTAGAIDVAAGGRLSAPGPLPAGADDLTATVHRCAREQRRVRDLPDNIWVRQSLDRLHDRLTDRDLLVPPARRTTARWLGAAMLALTGVGVLRLIAGMSTGRPIGYLMLLLALTVPIGLFLTVKVPTVTAAGRRALAELARRHRHLAPSNRPSYATYGAADAAMGVALFGAVALWAMDPDFAQTAEIERNATNSGGGDGGGSGDGGGGDGGGCGGCGG
ncbi:MULTISPECIES: TIGR04222 domain-containing membrane protein [unclassified Solwaraspora]|uniref:TIGR04222 domain-containing membrane protein n=1 Tax=unclassified Solwaraspora TaxID=2627926 RepID=UPI00259B389D|nr:TIGR04222 domain-containing membrane protein [Solwaraspora sp. WMMA2056]WJK38353.1 TIGR04222 domain-containing membrane protein [Solwaraspora sp. WMMA2056]